MSRPQPATRAAPSYTTPPAQRTNRAAVWSLLLSIITLGGLGSLAGIVLGIKARRRILETGERGQGIAIAGIIVGVITLAVAIGYWALIAAHFGGSHGGGGGGEGEAADTDRPGAGRRIPLSPVRGLP